MFEGMFYMFVEVSEHGMFRMEDQKETGPTLFASPSVSVQLQAARLLNRLTSSRIRACLCRGRSRGTAACCWGSSRCSDAV